MSRLDNLTEWDDPHHGYDPPPADVPSPSDLSFDEVEPFTLGEISVDQRFDSALACAEGWRVDARRYLGRRWEWRMEKARRMEAIADRFVGEA